MASISKIPEGLISKTESFDAKTPITKVIPAVQKYGAIIVNQGGRYAGIIDTRVIYKYLQDLKVSKKQPVEKYAVRVPRITDTTSIDDVIYFFHKARSKALPYVKNDKIKGVMRRPTLLKVLLSLSRLEGITVGEVMSSPLIGIDINSTVSQAKAAMRNNKINRLVVLDGAKPAGLITNYDIFDQLIKPKERLPERKSYTYNPSNITLSNMTNITPKTIEQDSSLSDAVRGMVENDISSLIVTKGGKPVGIITELDIIESAAASRGSEANRIFVSGLDSETYQYEDEIKDALKAFIGKIEKLSKIDVEYVSVVVKKFKTKSYEIHARLSLGNQGVINSHITGHIFERTFSDLLDNLGKEVRKKKERYLSVRRVIHGAHPEEEVE